MSIIAVDPGITGGVAVLSNEGEFKACIDIPVTAKATGKGNQMDSPAFSRYLREWLRESYPRDVPGIDGIKAVYTERVSAMPGQGVTSMFNFGFTAGVIEGTILTLGLPLRYVIPQRWKKHFGLIGKDKDAARTLCIQRFPNAAPFLARKKDIGRADAILIALYGAETGNKQLGDMLS